jgi:hypothetical protein
MISARFTYAGGHFFHRYLEGAESEVVALGEVVLGGGGECIPLLVPAILGRWCLGTYWEKCPPSSVNPAEILCGPRSRRTR